MLDKIQSIRRLTLSQDRIFFSNDTMVLPFPIVERKVRGLKSSFFCAFVIAGDQGTVLRLRNLANSIMKEDEDYI